MKGIILDTWNIIISLQTPCEMYHITLDIMTDFILHTLCGIYITLNIMTYIILHTPCEMYHITLDSMKYMILHTYAM